VRKRSIPLRCSPVGTRRRVALTTAAAVLRGAALIGLLAAISAAAAPLQAQGVRGTLVEYPAGTPLPGGTVMLLDDAGVTVDSARASANGSFTVRARDAGLHTLYFMHPGYASVPSEPVRLARGEMTEHRFEVPLIGGAALSRMAETITLETRLQGNLTELCGEAPRAWEAGILVGVVRRRTGGQPLAGAIVSVSAPAAAGGGPFRKATVTSANGVYVLCNVPAGAATTRTETVGYQADEGAVEVRAGTVGWYDVLLRPRR
jgi:hypothetical protein